MASVTDSWVGITKIIGIVLARNEVGSEVISDTNNIPYVLSYAGGASGWSFGWNQVDLSKNSKALGYLTDILTNAIDPSTGNRVVLDVNTFLANYSTALTTHGSLSDAVKATISSALSSAYGKTYLANLFEQTTVANINYVLSELYKAGEKYVSAALEDPKILIQLCDYNNQFGLDVGGKMEKFLKGQSVPLAGGNVQISGDLDISDIRNFIMHTQQYIDSPNDVTRRFNNIDNTVTNNLPAYLVDKAVGGSDSNYTLFGGSFGTANIAFGGFGNDKLYGSLGNDVLSGGSGIDELRGDNGNDRLFGHSGNDLLIGGKGNDVLDGGKDAGNSDIDIDSYEDRPTGVNLRIVEFDESKVINPASVVFAKEQDNISNIERIDLTSGNDNVEISLLVNTKVQQINTGAGIDIVSITGSAIGNKPIIDLGAEDDVLINAPSGSIVYGRAGNDTFALGQNYLVADAEAGDKFVYFDKTLNGGVSWRGQENPWTVGLGGIKYAKNDDGELVIEDKLENQTFVSNFNFEITGPRTAGILIGQMSMDAYHLFHTPNGAKITIPALDAGTRATPANDNCLDPALIRVKVA